MTMSPRQDEASGSTGQRIDHRESEFNAWLRARVRLGFGLRVSGRPRAALGDDWAPVRALSSQLCRLPPELWSYLLSCDGGFVVIAAGESHYQPGPVALRRQRVRNVAFVSVKELAGDGEGPLHVVGHLIDHYVGCGGAAVGAWLSEGGGANHAWKLAGVRLSRLLALGYGEDAISQRGPRDQFAQSMALYCRDRLRLSAADPPLCKWFRGTLWNAAFWRHRLLAETWGERT